MISRTIEVQHGFALRVLYRSGRRFDDYVLFQRREEDQAIVEAPPGGEFRILSHTPIELEAEYGPVLIVDRLLPTRFEDPAEWVERATTNLIPGLRMTDDQRESMKDDGFWDLIDLMNSRVDHHAIARLAERLRSFNYLRLVAFRDALWDKLHKLDHPENTVRIGNGDEGVVSADASLYFRCEIVARGRRAYDAAIADPHRGSAGDGATGEGLLSVAQDVALSKLLPPEVDVETGSNRDNWPYAEPRREPWMELPSLSPFSPRVFDVDYAMRDEVAMRLNFTSFVGYATGPGGQVRELMGCLMAASFANARREVTDFLSGHLRSGEVLDDHLVIWQSGAAKVMEDVSMTGLSRRRSLSMDDYIDTYYTGSSIMIRQPK